MTATCSLLSVLYFQKAVYREIITDFPLGNVISMGIIYHQIVKKPQPATKIQYVNAIQIYENLTT